VEDRERIFDRFYRVASTQSGHSGSGLGLAIVKTIAEMHGARLVIGQSTALGGLKATVDFAVSPFPTEAAPAKPTATQS
jgi:two-component system OmpR family sensor kinase